MGKRHRENYSYKRLRVDGYAALIRKALENKNIYNDSLEITIHMLACCLTRFAEIQRALDEDDLIVTTCSREKDLRRSVNPLFVMQEHQAEQIRKYLRELKLTNAGMTIEADNSEGGDLDKLYDAINGNASKGPHLLKPLKDGTN